MKCASERTVYGVYYSTDTKVVDEESFFYPVGEGEDSDDETSNPSFSYVNTGTSHFSSRSSFRNGTLTFESAGEYPKYDLVWGENDYKARN